jgi:hypothetical protein
LQPPRCCMSSEAHAHFGCSMLSQHFKYRSSSSTCHLHPLLASTRATFALVG